MKVSAPALITVVLLGCASAPQSAPTNPGPNTQTVRALYDAFGRGDIPAVVARLDENVVWMEAESIPPAQGNPYRGPRAVVEGVFGMIPTIWNDFRVSVERVIDGGNTVVALGRYRATSKQTGRPLDAQFVHVWDVQNGKVVRFQQYLDTDQFNRVARP
jgi:uncharacterized protein